MTDSEAQNQESDIYFYGRTKGRVDGCYRFLSNFYRTTFAINGKDYATVEHYFQSMKYPGTELEEQIRLAPTPIAAKKLAWEHSTPADWDHRKEDIMLTALRAKFMQNPKLAEKLVATGEARLHEDSPKDFYWGVRGRDRLGKLLMQVRDELREEMGTGNRELGTDEFPPPRFFSGS